MEDTQIVELYRARQETAVAETARKYGRYCHYIAYQILRSDEDAEECVNDAYLRAWDTIPPQNPDPLSAYVGMLTRRIALNRYKAKKCKKRGGGQILAALDEAREFTADKKTAETSGDLALRAAFNGFLGALPRKTRIIFMRRYWYFCSAAEIAADLGMSEGNVNVILHRTRNKLKNYLSKEGIFI